MLCSKSEIHKENCMLLTLLSPEPTGYVSKVEQNQIEELDGIFNKLSLGLNKSALEPLIRRQSPTCDELSRINARDFVLKRCNQDEPIDFDLCYPDSLLQKCHKIGEGVYGEVFLLKQPQGHATVLKIQPIEGTQYINGEPQKKFDEIITEIIITQELSNLRSDNELNRTTCFTKLQNVRCVRGKYPVRLIDVWELYEEYQGSDNDHPEIFGDEQLYIVFELEYGGRDLESYEFYNAEQSYSIFIQAALALGIAEKVLSFEHRDLHWGNLLIQPTDDQYIDFILNGNKINVETHGVKATIIDFTLSRITYQNRCIFNNLANEPDLFHENAQEYQFQIYNLMQQKNKNNWEHYEPYTNILWLHYVILKMLDGARYKRIQSTKHARNVKVLENISNQLVTYQSVEEFVEKFYFCKQQNNVSLF